MAGKAAAGATHVALLRGINVGRAKRIAMADLRDLVAGLGYGNVRTLLNSGNVVFDAPISLRGEPGPRIEKAIVAKLGISSRVTVLTAAELDAIVRENPLMKFADTPSRLMVAVLADASLRARLAPLGLEDWGPEVLAIGKRASYLWFPEGIIDSRLFAAMGKILGDGVTVRNWGTITKLHALATAKPTR